MPNPVERTFERILFASRWLIPIDINVVMDWINIIIIRVVILIRAIRQPGFAEHIF